MGISKIIVEWDDCKDEQFCEFTFAKDSRQTNGQKNEWPFFKAFVLERYPERSAERRAAQLDKV